MPIRWLSREKCLMLMAKAVYGRLATSDAAGQPYITPLNFVLYDGKIYFHGGFSGRKLDNIRANPRVCFEVSRPGRLYTAPLAKNFSMRYWSILVFGRAAPVTDEEQRLFIMNKLMEKYASGYDYVPLTVDDMKACNLIEITIEQMSGKVSVNPI